jgi:tetraacyldisaccharide 4'-kinase
LALLLWPASLVYRALWTLRKWAYARGWKPSTRLPVPVVVVGNVMAGGAGKTPVVIAIARHLQAQGLRVGVVSRGYGRQPGSPAAAGSAVASGGDALDVQEVHMRSRPQDVGDEPLLIHRATQAPVVVGRNRVAAAQALLLHHPQTQVILSDDGLQHLALQRHVEICVFDERALGNGLLLPAGPLREPWPRAMPPGQGPHPITLYRGATPPDAGTVPSFEVRRTLAAHALSADGIRLPLATLQASAQQTGRHLVAVAGIAQPEAFFAMLRAQGLVLEDTIALPDHYDFSSWSWTSYLGKTVICTEKDMVKLTALKVDLELFAVPLELALPPAFWDTLHSALAAKP